MSVILRKKYYSNTTKNFVDVPTILNSTFDSTDIGASGSNIDDTIRLIPYGDALSTSKLGDLIGDLLHNDSLLNEQNSYNASLLGDGIIKRGLKDFEVIKLKSPILSSGAYLSSFGILGGSLKYKDTVIQNSTVRIAKTVTAVSPLTLTLNNTNDLSVGDLIITKNYPTGTQIASKTSTTVTLDSPMTGSLSISDPVVFIKIPVFGITGSVGVSASHTFDSMSGSGTVPIYRRDLIEFNILNNTFEIIKGKELSFIAPIHTQLDSSYQIVDISHVSGFLHKIKLKSSLRDVRIGVDFAVGNKIKIRQTDDSLFDGDWIITDVNTVTREITFRVDHVKNGDYYTSSLIEKTIGIVDIDRIALYSVPLIKHTSLNTSLGINDLLIIDRIENVFGFSGVSSSLNQVTKSLLIKDQDNFYGVKNRDYVHLCDNIGRPLDWEYGQSADQDPVIGYTSFKDSIYNESLVGTTWIESSLPQTYTSPNTSLTLDSFSNIPFSIGSINDDVFSTNYVYITEANIAIKNDPVSIGNEDLKYKLVSSSFVTGYTAPRSCNLTSTFYSRINESNLTLLGNILLTDFVLITEGNGRGQVAKIVSKDSTGFDIEPLKIPLNSSSTYIALRNLTDVPGSDGVLSSSDINFQTITGINGSFGSYGEYRKIKLSFNTIQINLSSFYFISLSQLNSPVPNPAWSTPPKILISSFNESVDSYWSPFCEVYYKTIKGFYGNSNENYFSIEDDLGNIGVENSLRTVEPHFRPSKYTVLARGLDDFIGADQEPPAENIVYVDVHTGRIKFKSGSEPSNVFVSYYKKDSFSSEPSDFSIIHKTESDSRNRTLQDKIAELDSHYTDGTTFHAPVVFNGIKSSFSESGFKGPFFVDPFDSFRIRYSLPNIFDNHKATHKDFMVKFSNHYFDEIVKLTKDSVYVLNDVFLIENIISEDTTSNSPTIDFQDYIDTRENSVTSFSPSVSGVESNMAGDIGTLSSVGINFYDEVIVPASSKVTAGNSFLKKRWNGGFKNDFSFVPDSAFYDTKSKSSIDGSWNEEYTDIFGEFQFVKSLLRKQYYENLNLPLSPSSLRRIKQRESIGVYTDQLAATGIKRSVGKIISEPLLNISKTKASKDLEEAFVYASIENSKGDLLLTKTSSNSIITGISTGLNTNLFDSINIDNTIYTVYRMINSSNHEVYVKKRIIVKDDTELEINDFTSLSGTSTVDVIDKLTSLALPSSNIVTKLKIVKYDPQSYGLLYAYSSGAVYFELRLKSDNSLVTNSRILIPKDSNSYMSSQLLIDAYTIDDNGVAIAWVGTSQTLLNIYRYEYTSKQCSLINEITVSSTASTTVSPKINNFHTMNDFVVSYSNNGALSVKRFDRFGIPKEVGNVTSGLVIDSSISFFDSTECNDNSLVFAYKKNTASPIDSFVFTKLDSYDYTMVTGVSFLSDSASNPINLNVLNEDCIIVSTRDSLNNLIQKVYFNNLSLVSSLSTPSITSNVKNVVTSEHGVLNIKTDGTSVSYDLVELRPPINVTHLENTPISNSGTYNAIKNVSLNDNEEAVFFLSSTVLKIQLYNRWDKVSYSTYLNFDINKNISNFDAVYVPGPGATRLLIVSIISAGNLELYFYKKISTATGWTSLVSLPALNSGPVHLNAITLQSVKLLYAGSNRLFVFSNSGTVIYSDLLLLDDFFTLSNPSFNSNNSSFPLASVPTIATDSNTFKVLSLRETNSYSDSIGIVHDTTIKISVLQSAPDILPTISSFINANLPITLITTTLVTRSASEFSVTPIVDKKTKKFSIGFIDNTNNIKISEFTFVPGSVPTVTSLPISFSLLASTTLNNLYISYCSDKVSYDVIYFNSSNEIRLSIINRKTSTATLSTSSFSKSGGLGFNVIKLRDSYSLSYINSSGALSLNLISYPLGNPFNEGRVYKIGTKYVTNLYSAIKIGGIDFRGNPNTKITIDTYDTNDIEYSLIGEDGIYRSQNINSSNISILNFDSGKFTVVIHDKNDSMSKNFIRIRHFVFERQRVFPTSEWIKIQISDLNQLNIPESSRIDLSLKAISKSRDILLCYGYSGDVKFTKLEVQDDGSIVPYSYSGYNGVKYYREVGRSFKVLGAKEILDGNTAVLVIDNLGFYRTLLLDKNEDLLFQPQSFEISNFKRGRDIIGEPIITPFGYFYHTYIKTITSIPSDQQKLMVYQHGWDGTKFGSVQLIGKNYIEAIKTTPDSFIEKIAIQAVASVNTYERIAYLIPNNQQIQLNTSSFFLSGTVSNGMYDIWAEDDPLISAKVFIKMSPLSLTFISNNIKFENKSGVSWSDSSETPPGKIYLHQTATDLRIVNKSGSDRVIVVVRNT